MNPLPKPNYTTTTVARNFSAEVKRVTSYKYISYGQEDPKFLREHSFLEIRLPSAATTKLAGTPVFLIIDPANDPVDDSSQLLSALPTTSRDRPTCIHLVKTAQGTQTEPHELEVSDVGEESIDRKPRFVSVDQATQSLPPQSSTSSQTNRPFQSSSITQTDDSFLSSSTTQSASIQTEAVSIQTEAVSTQTEVSFSSSPPTTLSAVQDSLLTLDYQSIIRSIITIIINFFSASHQFVVTCNSGCRRGPEATRRRYSATSIFFFRFNGNCRLWIYFQ